MEYYEKVVISKEEAEEIENKCDECEKEDLVSGCEIIEGTFENGVEYSINYQKENEYSSAGYTLDLWLGDDNFYSSDRFDDHCEPEYVGVWEAKGFYNGKDDDDYIIEVIEG